MIRNNPRNMLCRRVNGIFTKLWYSRRACYSVAVQNIDDIPSPVQLPFLGSILSILILGGPGKLHLYLDKRHKQLGPVFRDKIGPLEGIFLSDPDDIRSVFAQQGKYPLHLTPDPWSYFNKKHNNARGLLFMDGEEWLHFRRIMNNILLKRDVSWVDDSCDVAADLLIDRILSKSSKNKEFPNLEKELYKWSMDNMASVLLGAKAYRQHHKVLEPFVMKLADIVHLFFEHTVKLILLPIGFATKFNLPQWTRFENSLTYTLSAANELIDIMRDKFQSGDGLLRKMEDEQVGREDINRIVADLILGAGDTTTVTMEFVLYMISKNKDVQPKLRQGDKRLLRNVLRETLRLCPVVPFLNRILPHDATIGGYNVPAGTLLMMSIYTSGRDERYFKNPEQFLPDRWLRDDTYTTVMMQRASLPFAAGVRSCVGKKIAESQITEALSKIVKKFDVELCNEKDIGIILKMIAKPAEELRLKFHNI